MFDEIAAQLEEYGATTRKMFGHRCLMIGGKGFAVDHDDFIVLKLAEPEKSQALALEGSRQFEPMPGRPMREWIMISDEHEENWLPLAQAAMEYVQRLSR